MTSRAVREAMDGCFACTSCTGSRPIEADVPAAGCCGMAGTCGHEAGHRATSEAIYGQSWAGHVAGAEAGALLAGGYSCRSQVKLVAGVRLRHPVPVLPAHVRAVGAAPFHPAQAAAAQP